MKPRLFLLCLFLVQCAFDLFSQPVLISGRIVNENNQPVRGATVIFRHKDSSNVLFYQVSRSDGSFSWQIDHTVNGRFGMIVRHISYLDVQKDFSLPLNQDQSNLFEITMMPKTVELKEVIIKREPPMVIKSDTVQFNAASFRNAETRKLEDLLKNISGFTVDANGRISFNGRPVEKVLVEGDDIADQGYRMITKNLGAGLVDKVQVIDNFNDNRLLRGVSQSGKVGINLKMAPDAINKISGNISAGLSVAKRYIAEVSMICLARPVKMLSFINANNIAEEASGNIRYYYEQDQEPDNLSGPESEITGILYSGTIIPPQVNDRYRQDNADAGAGLMSSWKVGKNAKMKAMIGAGWLNLSRQAYAQNQTYISDSEHWETINQILENQHGRDNMASFYYHRDALKKHVSQVNFDLGTGMRENKFSNLSSGSITDSLRERLNGNTGFAYFKWRESFLIRNKKVLATRFELRGEQFRQHLDNESGRFIMLFGLDSNFTRSTQYLDGQRFKMELNIGISSQPGKGQFNYGIQLLCLQSDYKSSARFTSNTDLHDFIDTGEQKMKTGLRQFGVYFNGGLKTGKKTFLGLRSLAGFASVVESGKESIYPVFKADWSYIYAISLLNSVRLKYGFNADFDNFNSLYPSGLISGDGSVVSGSNFGGTTRRHLWTAGYYSSNVYHNSQWSASLSYTRSDNRYNNAIETNPYYTISALQPFQPNSALITSLNAEKFVSLIKSKLGGSMSLSGFGNTHSVNGDTGYAKSLMYSIEGRWSTGLSFPFNLETRARVIWYEGQWQEQNNHSRQVYFMEKIKFSAGKRIYAALIWNYYILSEASRFNGIDVFINWAPEGKWRFSVQGSNLLNAANIIDKKVLPYSSSLSSYQLVGRYLLLRAEIRL